VWQLFSEALILCALGGLVGLALGAGGVRWLVRLRPDHLARIDDVGVNWAVLTFVAAASMGSVVIFGLAPSLQLRKWDLMGSLREARNSQTPAGRGLRGALIVCQIMLGFVLVIGAGLMIRTLANIRRVNPGFEPQRLLTCEIEFNARRYPPSGLANFVEQWESGVRAVPGVESVGAISHLPLDDYPNWYSPYRPEGVPENEAGGFVADHRCVTRNYLQSMGTRLIAGRFFDEQDRAGGRQVVIVDELLARTAWPNQSAIGKRIQAEHFTANGIVPVWADVVGVVEHIRNHSLSQEIRPEIYIPFEQSPRTHLSFAVRTHVDPLSIASVLRQDLRRRDPELAMSKVRPMTAYVERAEAPISFTAMLAAVFASLALVLAAIGIYGVAYYSVSQRAHEMGVRMALGAKGGDVVRLVMREGLWLTTIGMVLGLAGSLAVSHYLRSLVYGISARDPLTYAIAAAAIPAAAIIGCWRPAARAAGVNPVEAMRAE
jgi:predicted permease